MLMVAVQFTSIAQPTDQLIQAENFEEALLNEFLMEDLDSHRKANNLPLLKSHEILEAAAFKQSEYLLKASSVSHEQENSKFKTLEDRVNFYVGRFYALGENIVLLYFNEVSSKRRNSRQLIVRTYSEAAKAAVNSWMENEDSKFNLLDPEFYRIGISSIINPASNQIIISLVLASENYENNMKVQDYSKIKEYDKNKCAAFLKEFPDLPELFSEAVKVKNNTLIFDSPNAHRLRKILSENNDAIAFDIVCRSQYECGSGNRLFPGEIQDGYLMSSISKSKIHSILDAENDEPMVLGNMPKFYQEESCEINIKFIKEDMLCESVPHNVYAGENIAWLNPQMLLSIQTDTLDKFEWKDSITIKLQLNEKDIASLDSILTYGSLAETELEEAKIKFSVSPINKLQQSEILHYRELLQEQLAIFGNNSASFKLKENWESYGKFASNRVYSLETKGMDTLEIMEYLKEEALEDEVLRQYMTKLNYIELELKLKQKLEGLNASQQKALYSQFVKNDRIAPAVYLQSKLYRQANNEELREISMEILPRNKKYLNLINNQLVFLHKNYPQNFEEGKSLQQSYRELYSIDPTNKTITYNYLYSQLKLWAEVIGNVENEEEWLSMFKSLNKSNLPDKHTDLLLLNYYILLADHYYEISEARGREKALGIVYNSISKKELSELQANYYSEYFMFQLRIPWAIEVLKEYAMKEQPSSKTLENILSLKVYDQGMLNEAEWMTLFQKMSELYESDFCAMFNKDKIGFQQLKDTQLKSLYCEKCDH